MAEDLHSYQSALTYASSVREWMETLVLPYASEKLAFEPITESAVAVQQA